MLYYIAMLLFILVISSKKKGWRANTNICQIAKTTLYILKNEKKKKNYYKREINYY